MVEWAGSGERELDPSGATVLGRCEDGVEMSAGPVLDRYLRRRMLPRFQSRVEWASRECLHPAFTHPGENHSER